MKTILKNSGIAAVIFLFFIAVAVTSCKKEKDFAPPPSSSSKINVNDAQSLSDAMVVEEATKLQGDIPAPQSTSWGNNLILETPTIIITPNSNFQFQSKPDSGNIGALFLKVASGSYFEIKLNETGDVLRQMGPLTGACCPTGVACASRCTGISLLSNSEITDTFSVTGTVQAYTPPFIAGQPDFSFLTDPNYWTAPVSVTFKCTPSTGTGNLMSNLTDSRDGQVYITVLIGNQWWMAENLNYGTYVPVASGGQNPAGTQKYCQNLSEVNDPTCPMGGLYEWAEMMDGSVSCNGTGAPPNDECTPPVQGVCPTGWHVPSHYEWTTLERNVGSNPGTFPYDVSTTGWLGTDESGNLKQTGTANWTTPNTGATNNSGFAALPGGFSWSGEFYFVGFDGYWWSSTEDTEDSGTFAWNRELYYNNAQVYRNPNGKLTGVSVRCVKD